MSDSSSQSDDPIPSSVGFDLEDGSTITLTINWKFCGLACPEICLDSKDGFSGLIDNNPQTNLFIDLEPNQKVIENEGVQMLFGQLLALMGGRFGFMTSVLLGVNPALIFTDLDEFAEEEIDSIPIANLNWHPDWLAAHPRSDAYYGMGLFSLPYDWPMINWSSFCNEPLVELKKWMISVVSQTSFSGEPFIFSLSRWVSGLITNSTPDPSQWDLGWHTSMNHSSGKIRIIEPSIPYDISGDGTYKTRIE